MEDFQRSSRRTDEELEAIRHDVGNWVVIGRQGQALCSAASLDRAIDRAQQYAVSGAVVTAICRQPGDNIIIFIEQMDRLRRRITVREMAHPVPG